MTLHSVWKLDSWIGFGFIIQMSKVVALFVLSSSDFFLWVSPFCRWIPFIVVPFYQSGFALHPTHTHML